MCRLSPVHIGTGRESYDVAASELHSDTLSAALASIAVTQGVINGDEVETFLRSFRISSAFPFWKNYFFLPKPQGRLSVQVKGMEEFQYRKQLKKVKFVELSLWNELISGHKVSVDISQLHGAFLIPLSDNPEPLTISKSQVNERVCVPRDGDEATPFFFDWHYYNKDAGLYCLIDMDDTQEKRFLKLFESLGESGIGTDKSIGGGHFEVETDSLKINEPADANASVLLSLYVPSRDEYEGLFTSLPRYSLLLRGGYMAGSSREELRHLRKKSVYMFGVGSVFHTANPLEGCVVNVMPQWNDSAMHPVFRSGRALSLKIKDSAYE